MLKVITCSQKVILDMGKRCSIVFFVIFLVTASILSTVECNASGPPAGACTTLSPLQSAHLNAPAQTTPVPYDVDLSALAGDNGTFSYKPGMTYRREYSMKNPKWVLQLSVNTVELPNLLGTQHFVLCREAILLWRLFCIE